jgi:hypothetical protein
MGHRLTILEGEVCESQIQSQNTLYKEFRHAAYHDGKDTQLKANLMILGPKIPHPKHFLKYAQLAKNPFATVFFRNDLVTDCFYRDSFSNHDI